MTGIALRTDSAVTEVIDDTQVARVHGGLCGHCRGELRLREICDGQKYQCPQCGTGLQFFVSHGQITQKPWVCA